MDILVSQLAFAINQDFSLQKKVFAREVFSAKGESLLEKSFYKRKVFARESLSIKGESLLEKAFL